MSTPCPVCGEGEYEGLVVQFGGESEQSTSPWGSSGVRMTMSVRYDPDDYDDWIYTVKCSAREEPHAREEVIDELRDVLSAMFKRGFQKPDRTNGNALGKLPKGDGNH